MKLNRFFTLTRIQRFARCLAWSAVVVLVWLALADVVWAQAAAPPSAEEEKFAQLKRAAMLATWMKWLTIFIAVAILSSGKKRADDVPKD